MVDTLRRHWPEYLMEAALLGLFMVSACLFGALLEHPSSPVRQAVAGDAARRALMGLAMGLTAVAIVYSPWGKQSGAHINPSITFTFLRLGKIRPWDAAFYAAAQLAGGLGGVLAAAVVLGGALRHPLVNFVVTRPGPGGAWPAFVAEVVISFLLMAAVLVVSNSRHERLTGVCAGLLVATWITVEAPISGMSMNPARSFASALPAMSFSAFWVYVVAPPLGMLAAAETYLRSRGAAAVRCAKLHHRNPKRCIFCQDTARDASRPALRAAV